MQDQEATLNAHLRGQLSAVQQLGLGLRFWVYGEGFRIWGSGLKRTCVDSSALYSSWGWALPAGLTRQLTLRTLFRNSSTWSRWPRKAVSRFLAATADVACCLISLALAASPDLRARLGQVHGRVRT